MTRPDLDEEALRAWLRAATEPSPEAAARLRAEVHRQVDAVRGVDQAARSVGEPDAGVRQRLHQRVDVATAPRDRRWLGWAAAATALAAAAGLVVGGGWVRRADPMQHVHLQLDGVGHVDASAPHPTVVWEDGRLDVEVDPNHGVNLAIRTPEATVTVVGTGFTVDRAAFATEVNVRHGIVDLACADGSTARLTAGDRGTCLPIDPAALLRRVVALGPAGDPDARRRAIEAGLAAADADAPIRVELLARKVELLASIDPPAAVAAAEAYLALDAGSRRRAMLGFVAAHRYAAEGCSAVEAMRAAVADDPDSPLAAPLRACEAGTDP